MILLPSMEEVVPVLEEPAHQEIIYPSATDNLGTCLGYKVVYNCSNSSLDLTFLPLWFLEIFPLF